MISFLLDLIFSNQIRPKFVNLNAGIPYLASQYIFPCSAASPSL